jgi:hypothetical protein
MADLLVPESRPARVVFRVGREHLSFNPPNLLLTTLYVAAAAVAVTLVARPPTFAPQIKPRPALVEQVPNTLLTLLSQQVSIPPVVVPVPFNQEDWPNPLRPWQRDLTWTNSPEVIPPVVLPVVTPVPFVQEDWPNPLRSPIRDLTWTQTPEVIPQVPDIAVANRIPNQTDWPNPQRSPIRDLTWTQTPQVVPQVPPVTAVQAPFEQADWPNPIRSPVRDLTWTQSPEVIPQVQPVFVQPPFAQGDWPNPLRPWVRDLTWTQTPEAIPQVAPIVPVPFAQEDWPNPARLGVRDLTWTQTAQLQTPQAVPVVPLPFVQLDWTNPQRLGTRELTWLQSPQVPQIVPEAAGSVFPFSLIDWPNPVLRTPFKESGWIHFANIGDIPAAAPVVPVPPVPTDEVKPSGGRVDHEFQYAIEGRRTYVQKLRDWRIEQEAAQVIEQVALQQAATLEINEAKNARELKRALRLAKVEDDSRYLELLAERRELAKNEEIGALLYKTFQDEEDILALLMIAAQLL